MRNVPGFLLIVTAVSIAASCGSETSSEPVAREGEALFAKYCALCHGDRGEGYRADQATQLANAEFLTIASDAYLRRSIAQGRPGTTMSAWARARGGPLDDRQLDALVAYIGRWRTRPLAAVDADVVVGDASRGAPVYSAVCESCHGPNGANGPNVQLSNPEFLAVASDGFLRASIERGRPGTPMLAYGGALSNETIGDLVRLVRGWERPVEGGSATPPRPGALSDVVINPTGPDATLPSPADFVKADDVKGEIDRGAALVIVDARPPSDYVKGHIAGAISVPFYEVDAYAPQIPKERYVVTYCACPHAISSQARDAFRRLGYPRAAVLDEGVTIWQQRGYPMSAGIRP